VGFAHGVMNTDNMSITGLTIDYGPFGFMERFDPGFICNHSDEAGRYAFDQQPAVALWNLAALAHALQSLVPPQKAKAALDRFAPAFRTEYNARMAAKLGLDAPDEALLRDLLVLMAENGADYTLTFRGLAALDGEDARRDWFSPFRHEARAKDWLSRWEATGAAARKQRLRAANPKYVLRNWVAETAIRAAEDRRDYGVLGDILEVLQSPFEEHSSASHLAALPPDALRGLCVSCSS
jgi:uncharacterized protein YdiU (UPF0061 family)